MENTEIQNRVVKLLSNHRFLVDVNTGDSVFLSRRHPKIRSMTQYAEVDANGRVNGMDLVAFLKTL